MTHKSVPLIILASPGEQKALAHAAVLLTQSCRDTSQPVVTFDCQAVETVDALLEAPSPCIRIVSLLPEVGVSTPWAIHSQVISEQFQRLAQPGDPVFVTTVFRASGHDAGFAERRIQIRRLNWLAAELSRETGAYVIDLDRTLADIGAIDLQCDYRLLGSRVAEPAGFCAALTISAYGLDSFIDFTQQERIGARLIELRPQTNQMSDIKPVSLVSVGQGRRRQTVATHMRNDQQGHINWLIDQVIGGQIDIFSGFNKLLQAVRRRGAKDVASRLAEGVFKRRKNA